ncbi:MAG TPA: Na+/H+ antiporter [Parafilimonas sp.]|nr:Na+/H+ antiporter [Parafilimonas sp.]
MDNFEIVIFLMTVLIVLSAITDKIKLPNPIVLVFIGLIIGFLPFLPNLKLDPEIVFLVFLPPLLYDAAFKTSWLDFKKEIRAISTLAITLVFFSTVIVAVAAHYLIPGFSWPISFLLGAIISPPDAVAATNIIKGLGLNKRVVTVIEGESLLNDASALIAYRYALAATLSGSFVLWKAGLQFIFITAGGILAGLIVGYALVFAHKKIKDNAIVETSLSLITPFLAYLLAEEFHVSGILAVVTAGILIGWHSREIFSFQTRLQTTIVWNTVIFLLNGIVFILIGLQLPEFVTDLKTSTLFELIGYGLIISVVTIIIRILWVFAGAYHQRIFRRKKLIANEEDDAVNWKNVLIVAWTGTRGVVSLAAALALPFTLENGGEFPKRHSILLLTFTVILVTLVIQGLTLPILIKLLNIKSEKPLLQKEQNELNLLLAESSLHFINNNFSHSIDETVINNIKRQYEFSYNLLSKKNGNYRQRKESELQLNSVNQFLQAQLEIIKFQRELLMKFQNEDRFSEEALANAERELDIEELRLNSLIQKKEGSISIANTAPPQ